MSRSISGFAKYAWFVLVYNLGVVLWGAYVRATGSGAGCGSHWPLCNGVVVPREPQIETLIEFTHRLMSGVSILLLIGLLVWALRALPKGHPARFGAKLSMVLIITEALVGAALVLNRWVATDESTLRVYVMGLHLINTFLLIGALALTAWWASGGPRISLSDRGPVFWALVIGLSGVMLIGVSGAVTALGDTLFPEATMADNFSATAHLTIRLRIWHPIIAVTVGLYLIFISTLIWLMNPNQRVRRFAIALPALVITQLLAGLINLILHAPVFMQIVHLLLADLVWITLVLMTAMVITEPHAETQFIEEPVSASSFT